MEDEEWIHPAAMGRPHEDVAAARRQEVSALATDPEAEQAEQDQPRDEAGRSVLHARPDLGLAAQPVETLAGIPPGAGEGLRGDARLWQPRA